MKLNVPTIFSRILLVLGVLAALVSSYYLIRTWLAPVPVPPAPAAPKAVRFDPRLDVTKSASFQHLRPITSAVIELPALGRSNPFVAPPPVPTSTRTAEIRTETATSTPAATSTL